MNLPIVLRVDYDALKRNLDRTKAELDQALHNYGEMRRVATSFDLNNAELRRQLRERKQELASVLQAGDQLSAAMERMDPHRPGARAMSAWERARGARDQATK